MKRDFQLPESDVRFLNATGLGWETIRTQGVNWVIIHDLIVPEGYNQPAVRVAIRLESSYPDTPPDMVYFFPNLQRLDGIPIRATTQQTILGTSWQRWSRHRTRANPWRPGLDDLESHFLLVQYWLEREFDKRKV